MIHFALVALMQAQTAQQPPLRDVTDPGVIATGQRISPAGVQSVFTGRVAGVRFGPNSPGGLGRRARHDLSPRLASESGDGARSRRWRAGFHGVAIDPVTHRALVSSVGRLPATSETPGVAPVRQPAVSYLSALSGDAAGDSLSAEWRSPALGDYIAGATAVASAREPGRAPSSPSSPFRRTTPWPCSTRRRGAPQNDSAGVLPSAP